MDIVDLIKKYEGFSRFEYIDTRGISTIGYGFDLKYGFSPDEATAVLRIRINNVIAECQKRFSWFNELSMPRQDVIISMVYQLGMSGFMQFKDTLEAISGGKYEDAAKYMLESKWAIETPNRAKELAEMMKAG